MGGIATYRSVREDPVVAKPNMLILVTVKLTFLKARKSFYYPSWAQILLAMPADQDRHVVRSVYGAVTRQDLSLEQRTEKKDRLYQYLCTSEDYRIEITENVPAVK